MPELLPVWAIDLVKYVGFPAMLFLVWYASHKSNVKQISDMLGALSDERKTQLQEMRVERDHVFAIQRQQQERDTEAIKELTSAVSMQGSILMTLQHSVASTAKALDDFKDELRRRNG